MLWLSQLLFERQQCFCIVWKAFFMKQLQVVNISAWFSPGMGSGLHLMVTKVIIMKSWGTLPWSQVVIKDSIFCLSVLQQKYMLNVLFYKPLVSSHTKTRGPLLFEESGCDYVMSDLTRFPIFVSSLAVFFSHLKVCCTSNAQSLHG